ncbi:MAG: hypothetical protein U5K51_06630 [Flavobacteriaceae bacterium]|nr:hypothetical protein [Flavobacteriaceae bacterium]
MPLTVEEGEEVDLLVMHKTDLGYSVIVNHKHKGLVFQNEIFGEVRIGDQMKGYVKKIREGNKLDIALQPQGYKLAIEPHAEIILKKLADEEGLPFHDRSDPEDTDRNFGITIKLLKRQWVISY